MNTKGDANYTVIIIIIAFIAALVLLIFIIISAGAMSGVMSDSVCAFAVFFRQLVLGNPISKIGQQLTSGLNIIPMDIPLPCRTGTTRIGGPDSPLTQSELKILIADEAKRCWALFGSGKWDALLWSAKGQKFLCFDDDVYFNGDTLDRTDIKKFMLTTSVNETGGTKRTYDQVMPDEVLDFSVLGYNSVDGKKLCPTATATDCLSVNGDKIFKSISESQICATPRTSCSVSSGNCECLPRRYRIFVYFIDYISPAAVQYVNLNSMSIDTVCTTYVRNNLGGDLISVCIQEIEQ